MYLSTLCSKADWSPREKLPTGLGKVCGWRTNASRSARAQVLVYSMRMCLSLHRKLASSKHCIKSTWRICACTAIRKILPKLLRGSRNEEKAHRFDCYCFGVVSIVILFNTGCHKNSATMIVDGTIDCDEINVSSKVTGRIKDLFVDEGTIHSLPLTARCWASFDADRAMCCRFFFEWLQTMLCGIQ